MSKDHLPVACMSVGAVASGRWITYHWHVTRVGNPGWVQGTSEPCHPDRYLLSKLLHWTYSVQGPSQCSVGGKCYPNCEHAWQTTAAHFRWHCWCEQMPLGGICWPFYGRWPTVQVWGEGRPPETSWYGLQWIGSLWEITISLTWWSPQLCPRGRDNTCCW